MKSCIISLLVAFVFSVNVGAQNGAYFTGRIKGGKSGGDSIHVRFRNDLVFDLEPESDAFYVKVNKDGKFNFHLPPAVNNIGRLMLSIDGANNSHIAPSLGYLQYYVENTDSINIEILLSEKGEIYNVFSGKGVVKYLAANSVFSIRSPVVTETLSRHYYSDKDSAGAHIRQIASQDGLRFNTMKSVLDYYKSRMNPDVYNLFLADAIANGYGHMMAHAQLYFRNDKFDLLKSNDFLKSLKTGDGINENLLASSEKFVQYQIDKLILEERVKNQSKDYSLSDIYTVLKEMKNGVLKDKVIAYYLYNQEFRVWENNTEGVGQKGAVYANIVSDAVQYQIQNPRLKNIVQQNYNAYKKSATAMDFELTAYGGNKVRLSDFRGKVVFIDVYGPGCTACVKFAKRLKEKIIPEFKDNPSVKFVAVSIEKDKNVWIKDLETSERNASTKLQTCLWTEGLQDKHPFTESFKVRLYPTILLIDKDGKVFSSSNDELVLSLSDDEVIALINKALKSNL